MILGEVEITGYRDEAGNWVSADEVERDENGGWRRRGTAEILEAARVEPGDTEKSGDKFVVKTEPDIALDSRAHKMSKSRGNVINPDTVVKEYGADSLRLYEMYMGPLEAPKPWNMDGVNGVYRFLSRAWRMIVDQDAESPVISADLQNVEPTEEQTRMLHKTIAAVTHDTAAMSFNTAIARMMEFVNFFTKLDVRPRRCIEQFVLLLSPYAPHIAEELWEMLGHSTTLAFEPWPEFDEAMLNEATVEVPVQMNGKLKTKIMAPSEVDRNTLQTLAEADSKVMELLAGKQVVKTIVVPGRLVNFVTK